MAAHSWARAIAWVAMAIAGPASIQAQPCGHTPTFEDGRAPTRILHVAAEAPAQAAPPDGSRERPFSSLTLAARAARPGDALRLGPGEHRGGHMITDLAGTAQAPIWIGGEPGARIVGGGSALQLVRPRYVVVHDLEITGASGNGLNCDDGGAGAGPRSARHLVVRDLFVHDIGKDGNQDGIKLSGLSDVWVIRCRVERCGGSASGSGVDMVGCARGVIARCEFRELSANGVQCKGGTEDVEIRWCVFKDSGHRAVNIGGSTGMEFFRPPIARDRPNAEARDIRVVRNVIEGSMAAVAFVGAVDCVVAGNTIVRPGKWVARILQESRSSDAAVFLQCADNRFENNLVVFERSRVRPGQEINIGEGTHAESFAFTSNLWYAIDDPPRSAPKLPVPEAHAVVGQDPQLVDIAGDYRPRASSPAIGAARAPSTVGDLNGQCPRATIGAIEPSDT